MIWSLTPQEDELYVHEPHRPERGGYSSSSSGLIRDEDTISAVTDETTGELQEDETDEGIQELITFGTVQQISGIVDYSQWLQADSYVTWRCSLRACLC